MKKLVTLTVGALLFVASGCTSTVTVGPRANDSAWLGANASTKGASVTVPLVKASIATALPKEKKK
jgi:hypothetical protein